MKEITFISVCPICKAKTPVKMPDDLGAKEGETFKGGIPCLDCDDLLGMFAAIFPVYDITDPDKRLGVEAVSPVHAFFRVMCERKDPHILAFCKELLSNVPGKNIDRTVMGGK